MDTWLLPILFPLFVSHFSLFIMKCQIGDETQIFKNHGYARCGAERMNASRQGFSWLKSNIPCQVVELAAQKNTCLWGAEEGAGGSGSHLDEMELFKESTRGSLQIRKLEIDGNHLFTSVQKEMLPSFVIFCKLILRTNSSIYISSRGKKILWVWWQE